MYSAKLMLCAEGVVRDAESNTVSVYNIFEEIRSATFPVIIPKLFILLITQRDPAQDPPTPAASIRIQLDSDLLDETKMEVNFQDKSRNRFILGVGGLVVTRPGTLRFIANVAHARMAEYTVTVQKVGPPEVRPVEATAQGGPPTAPRTG
jgi:hypothetical protein